MFVSEYLSKITSQKK